MNYCVRMVVERSEWRVSRLRAGEGQSSASWQIELVCGEHSCMHWLDQARKLQAPGFRYTMVANLECILRLISVMNI